MGNVITGIDIGGTHITVCLVDIDQGKLIEESHTRAYADTSLDIDPVISLWADVILQSHKKAGIPIEKIGIAMPGPFDYENGISYIKGLHKYESLYGINVRNLLAEKLRIDAGSIRLINDASAYLLGEMRAGAGKGYNNLVGITLGTGLGSAAYYNDTLHEGDLYCTDFENGKCEDFISARWIIAEYEKLSGIKIDNVKDIAARCDMEKNAQDIFERFGANLFNILHKRYRRQSPELVLIGGNIARAWNKFIPSATNEMRKAGFHFIMKRAELGEGAALIGAAYLWAG